MVSVRSLDMFFFFFCARQVSPFLSEVHVQISRGKIALLRRDMHDRDSDLGGIFGRFAEQVTAALAPRGTFLEYKFRAMNIYGPGGFSTQALGVYSSMSCTESVSFIGGHLNGGR